MEATEEQGISYLERSASDGVKRRKKKAWIKRWSTAMRCKRNATEISLDASKIIVSVVQDGCGIVEGKETRHQKIDDCQ